MLISDAFCAAYESLCQSEIVQCSIPTTNVITDNIFQCGESFSVGSEFLFYFIFDKLKGRTGYLNA